MLEIPKRNQRRHAMGAFERMLEDERRGRNPGQRKPPSKPGKNAKRKKAKRDRITTAKKLTRDKGYAAYLDSAGWKRKRAWIIRERGGKCEICSSGHSLTVHHLNYTRLGMRGRRIYRYSARGATITCTRARARRSSTP